MAEKRASRCCTRDEAPWKSSSGRRAVRGSLVPFQGGRIHPVTRRSRQSGHRPVRAPLSKYLTYRDASEMREVASLFFWRLARAAPCCPFARNSMKTW